MVNRGWLPADKVDSEMEKGRKLKLSGLKELNAIVRSGEKVSIFFRIIISLSNFKYKIAIMIISYGK